MNRYLELQVKQRAEMSTLKMFFAFSPAQFDEGVTALGVDVISIGGGAYAPRSERPTIDAMFNRHQQEREAALLDDAYLFDALLYQLANHEYCYTGRAADVFGAVGVTETDARVKRIFEAARTEYLNNCKEN